MHAYMHPPPYHLEGGAELVLVPLQSAEAPLLCYVVIYVRMQGEADAQMQK